jgi:hypothetical protein
MRFEAELSSGTMTQRTDFRTSRQEAPEELVLAFAEGGFPPRETGHGKGTQPKKGRGTSRSRSLRAERREIGGDALSGAEPNNEPGLWTAKMESDA